MVFESRPGKQWIVTQEAAAAAWYQFTVHLEQATFLRRSAITLHELEHDVESLVARYTARHGFRTYDILHVAAARALSCSAFLSFDIKGSKAGAAGRPAHELRRLDLPTAQIFSTFSGKAGCLAHYPSGARREVSTFCH